MSVSRTASIAALAGAAGTAVALFALPGFGTPRVDPVETVEADGSRTEIFHFSLPQDGIAVTHGGHVPLPAAPPGVPVFSKDALKRGFALLVRLRNAEGRVIGMAAELEVHPEGDMLATDLAWDTDWILVLPGRGMLVLHQQEHSGELGPKVINPTLASGQDWIGDWTVQTTVGPGAGRRGVILGGSGEFTDSGGSFVEIDRLTRFSLTTGLSGRVELRLNRSGIR
ncbi:MAG: hypothetical protein HYR49_04625 [Gammaproteobacteria bacterium]|nr:hypothetical protein [Gammaproteobacteria bacterium]